MYREWHYEWEYADVIEQKSIMEKYASMLVKDSNGLFTAKVTETTNGLNMWILSNKCSDIWIKCMELERDNHIIYPAKLILTIDPLKPREYVSSGVFLERLIAKYIASDIVYKSLCNIAHVVNKRNMES